MFEPNWTFELGATVQQGAGLLYPPLWSLTDADLFSVRLNGTQLVCRPKTGEILKNLQPVLSVSPGKLIWFRRMQIKMEAGSMGESTNRQMPSHCVFYGLGIENASGRFGCRLYEDGRVEQGLEP